MMIKNISEWIDDTDFETAAENWIDLFKNNVDLHPDKTAVFFQNTEYSYKQLDDLSNRFAWEVHRKADPGDFFIGICVKRSFKMLAAMIGIQKAGKAYLPVDADFPEERFKYMLNDSALKLIITDDIEKFSGFTADIHFIETSDAEPLETGIISEISGNDYAYILYTSGSTGLPKGVVVQHKAFLNFLLSMQQQPGCLSDDIVLALTTISFDISGLELFLPLISGGSVLIASSEDAYDPATIVNLIMDNDVTIAQTTASYWKLIMDAGFKGKDGLKILCGGEFFPGELALRLFDTQCEVWNMYGPTETTIWSSVYKIETRPEAAPPIGFPIANTGLHILDDNGNPVKPGDTGLLWISGKGLASCYWNNKELTDKMFKNSMYNTGDYVHEASNGCIVYEGRSDSQIKLRGMRIESAEIESILIRYPAIKDAVVLMQKNVEGHHFLAAFYISQEGVEAIEQVELRSFLKQYLPEYMIPSCFRKMNSFPRTLNNKINRNAFPNIDFSKTPEKLIYKDSSVEEVIHSLWVKALNHSDFRRTDNFFDVGGHSFLLIQITRELSEYLGRTVSPIVFFENPTVKALCKAIGGTEDVSNIQPEQKADHVSDDDYDDFSVAIIGMSCAVPGAENVDDFWTMLENSSSGIVEYSDEELLSEGITEEEFSKPNYVRKSGYLGSARYFDNEFFGYSPKEARFMDPQHRLLLEHSYKAIEASGIDPFEYNGRIGVFAGCSRNNYLIRNILFSSEKSSWSDFQTMIGNDNDFLSSRVAYKLNLKGPALTIQTACSTSLVAVQTAYQSLLNYQCDAAVCGGVSVNLPEKGGYEFHEGSILSRDGICRAFDKDANGTIFGSGVGVVVLKRLRDAERDGDPVIAVIRGAAVNNDGSAKIGYTAPGVKGQAEVIEEALALSNIKPNMVSYVETHGTGTRLGDPIEFEGLKRAYGNPGVDSIPCYLGSVKTNIGHLDAAAGVVGLIKTAMALKNRRIPQSLNYSKPNPELDIENTRFKVNNSLRKWEPIGGRMIAGVSSFGIGGTNAHVVLESYKQNYNTPETENEVLIFPVSARDASSQSKYSQAIINFVKNTDEPGRLNTAVTLINGRHNHEYRGFFLQKTGRENVEPVVVEASKRVFRNPAIVIMLPGQGAQYMGMGNDLYDSNKVYRKYLDSCLSIIDRETSWNSKKLLFKEENWVDETEYSQPLLFSVEYAIVKTLIEYGIGYDYLIGHSLGEITAACIAGAFTLEDAIRLVVIRGRIMAKADPGEMIAAFCPLEDIRDLITSGIDIAGYNAPEQVVLSGSAVKIDKLRKKLDKSGIMTRTITERYGFHSSILEPLLNEFADSISDIEFSPIKKPVISNVEGNIWEPGSRFSIDYWVRHLRGTVKFYQGASELNDKSELVFVEAGPGAVLSKFIRTIHAKMDKTIIQTLPSYGSEENSLVFFTKALGNIWRTGTEIDLSSVNSINRGRRIEIPTYPFLRREHWVMPDRNDHLYNSKDETTAREKEQIEIVPASTTEQLREIWLSILGYEDIKIDHNFFNLGGDSLLAAELAKQIKHVFNLQISIKDIILHPVFKDLESYIKKHERSDETEDEFSILFPVNPSGSKPPLFLVAGAHDNQYYHTDSSELKYEEDFMRYFSSILHVLGSEQPLYGFRPKGIFYGEKMHRNVQEMAASYIEELKKVQPSGPYYIGGECIGGIVAYEMALQLRSQGEEIANLILMDTPKPGLYRVIAEEYKELRQRYRFIRNKLRENKSSKLAVKAGIFNKEIKGLLESYFPVTRQQREEWKIKDSRRFFVRKLLSYKPQRNEITTTLIINEEWNSLYPNLRWTSDLLPNLEVHIVPGGHLTRISEFGSITAEIISDIISV